MFCLVVPTSIFDRRLNKTDRFIPYSSSGSLSATPLSDRADHVIVSVNPKAGRRSPSLRAEELQGRLREKGFQVELLSDSDEIVEKARTLHAEGRLRVLIGVGGDGTAAMLVNRTEAGTPVSLLSAGTANLLAKHFQLGRTPRQLTETILDGRLLTLDAGRVVTKGAERLFLVMVGCGFDADVVRQVHAHRELRYETGHKKGAHISYFSYVKPICRSLSGYRFPKIQVETVGQGVDFSDAVVLENRARWAFFFNLNAYGWGIPIAPYARGNDGLLDHVLLRGGTIVQGFWYTAWAQMFGMHRYLPDVRLGQASRYRVSSEETVPFQLDGDPGGELPIEIEVIPNRFTLLVPRRTAERFERRSGSIPTPR